MRESEANHADTHGLWMGFVINKPGPREAGAARTFRGPAQTLAEVAHFANPNAKVSTSSGEAGSDESVAVIVDPPMKFVFSHIEWLVLSFSGT
ncbi:MAG: hypothetical protein HC853_17910 [Anaerolineae bacterium]|nr:hypothetical protein [Anaerolineae bacterium]